MESEEESIRRTRETSEFEFSEEEVEEALKTKPGRPSNRTRELRKHVKDATRLKELLGILDSGILERLPVDEHARDSDSNSAGPNRVKKEPFEPEGFTSELLKQLKIFPDSFLEKNKNLLTLTDTVTESALIRFGPPAVALIAWWLAEENIKAVPPVLHTSVSILMMILRLVDVVIRAIAWWSGVDPLGGIKDALDAARSKPFRKLGINLGVEITNFLMRVYLGLFVKPKSEVVEDIVATGQAQGLRTEEILEQIRAQEEGIPERQLGQDETPF